MIRGIIKYGLLALIAILGYNYFAGSPAEKENAREIVKKVKSIGGSVKDLVKSEHLKYKDGKYDEVLNKTGSLLKKIKEKAVNGSDILIEKLERLDNKRKSLEDQLSDSDNMTDSQKESLKEQLKKLVDDTNGLADDIE